MSKELKILIRQLSVAFVIGGVLLFTQYMAISSKLESMEQNFESVKSTIHDLKSIYRQDQRETRTQIQEMQILLHTHTHDGNGVILSK